MNFQINRHYRNSYSRRSPLYYINFRLSPPSSSNSSMNSCRTFRVERSITTRLWWVKIMHFILGMCQSKLKKKKNKNRKFYCHLLDNLHKFKCALHFWWSIISSFQYTKQAHKKSPSLRLRVFQRGTFFCFCLCILFCSSFRTRVYAFCKFSRSRRYINAFETVLIAINRIGNIPSFFILKFTFPVLQTRELVRVRLSHFSPSLRALEAMRECLEQKSSFIAPFIAQIVVRIPWPVVLSTGVCLNDYRLDGWSILLPNGGMCIAGAWRNQAQVPVRSARLSHSYRS